VAEYDVSDQHSLRVNECPLGNNGNEAFEFIAIGHIVFLS
jgi:hypothetical protein